MVRGQSVIATFWSAVEQVGGNGINTIFIVALARLLTPEDFGVFAIATLAAGVVGHITQLGLESVIVQRPQLNAIFVSTACWLAVLTAVPLSVGLCLLSPVLAEGFSAPRVPDIMPYMAGALIVQAFCSPLNGLLRRELRMKTLAQRTCVASAASGAIGIAAAVGGAGPIALVAQYLSNVVFTMLMTLPIVQMRPRLVFDKGAAVEMLRFGLPLAGANVLTFFNRRSAQLFVGAFWGPQVLGAFAVAMRILNALIGVFGATLVRVVLPILSRARRDERKVEDVYIRLISTTAAGVLPVFLLGALLREKIVYIVLGAEWEGVSLLIGLFCGAGAFITVGIVNEEAAVAIGRPRARLWFAIVRALVGTAILVPGARLGPVPAAMGFLLVCVMVEPVLLLYLVRRIGGSATALVLRMWGPVAATMASLGIGAVVLEVCGQLSPLATVSGVGFVAVATYAIVLCMADRSLRLDVVALLPGVFNRQATRRR